jgi:hypothetical protein
MKTTLILTLALTAGNCLAQQATLPRLSPAIPAAFHLGAPVSNFSLRDMDGRLIDYSVLKGNVTAVIFFSTRCPMSNAFNFRRNSLYLDFSGRVKFVMIDSNASEPLEEVRNYALAIGFDFPVYKDVDNTAADLFGVQVTTETFVMDSSDAVRYHGYMEDSPNPTRAKTKGLRLAIEAVLEGKTVALPETHALGCTIIRSARP